MIELLYKNTLIKIKKSFGRYISIFIIVLVGVGFYAGIQSSAPDISQVAGSYYRSHRLMDFKIISSMGLSEDDVSAVKALNGVKDVIPSYSLDVLSDDKAIRLHAIEKNVNTIELTEGRMPQTDTECVADGAAYKIGDKINITSDVSDKLKNTEYTVTGLTQSVLYIARDYGNTTVGDGKLSSYIFVDKSNFVLEAYTEIYVTAAESDTAAAYSDKYKERMSLLEDELVKMKPDRENARYEEIYNTAGAEISENETKLKNEKADSGQKLRNAKKELDDNAQKLKNAKEELLKNEAKLLDMSAEKTAAFQSAKSKIADGWNQIDSATKEAGIPKEQIGAKINELDTAVQGMKAQLDELPADDPQYAQLSAAIAEYSAKLEGLKKLKDSVDTLTAQEKQLNDGIDTFNSGTAKAKKEIEKGKKELADNGQKLNDGYNEYYKNSDKFNTEIKDAEAKISDAKDDLSRMEQPKWYISGRSAAVGYGELDGAMQVITSVAAVFPVFFILIVILMTSNSMTRMIAEERGELGTLASLGYHDKSIISTYLLYVLSASGLGAAAGFFIGCTVIPPLIYSNFPYILPPLVIHYDMTAFIIIIAVTLVLMTLVTVAGCHRELKERPAALMRPLPPGHGQKIFLERVGFIWKQLSFTWKVTMRNMFRYKKRGVMAIVGVAGCTAILVVGFGLRDSMDGVAQKQYGDIFRYSNMIILKEETLSLSGDLKTLLEKEQITGPLLIRQSAYKCEKGAQSLDTYLIVPRDRALFEKYYNLKSTINKQDISLDDRGVVITQRLAKKLNAGKGDTVTVTDADNNACELTVADVAENYVSNYIYMEPSAYAKVFGKSAAYNAVVSGHGGDEQGTAEHLTGSGPVVNVIFTDDVIQKAVDNNNSLNSIIILLVVVASLLALVVLYNLTAINISERTREIATLKVLGFRDGETNAYIYREALLLTLISMGFGMILGIFLHRFVLDILETDASTLFKKIEWSSFAVSCLLTLVFSLIMQVITYFKLKTINMIESLKSVE